MRGVGTADPPVSTSLLGTSPWPETLQGALFLPPSRGPGYKEEEFSWSQYLRNTKAQAAPKHLFVSQSHVSI